MKFSAQFLVLSCKLYSKIIYMKKYLLLLGMFGFSILGHAQTESIIGTGSNTTPTNSVATADGGPVYIYGGTSTNVHGKYHYVYTQAELAAAGLVPGQLITRISWRKISTASMSSANPVLLDIYLKNSNATQLPPAPQDFNTLIAGASLVYSTTSQSFTADTGWVAFVFTTPFLYTGGALEVTNNWNISAAGQGASTGIITWAKDVADILNQLGSTASNTMSNIRTVKAQVRFTHIPNAPCVDPPTPGNTVTTAANVCAGQSFGLSLQGAVYGNGQLYQWQTSPDSINWVDITGATNTTLTTTQTTSIAYYRCNVTCGTTTLPSTGVRVDALVTALGGNYTIDPALPQSSTNFHSLTDILTHINCAGISSQTTISVAPGTYTGNFQITNFTGSQFGLNIASSTFNPIDVIFTNGGSGDVFTLNAANNVSFNNISVEITSIGAGFT